MLYIVPRGTSNSPPGALRAQLMPLRSHQEASGDVLRPIYLKMEQKNEAAEAAKTSGHLLHIILGHEHCGGVGAQRIEIINLIIIICYSYILSLSLLILLSIL